MQKKQIGVLITNVGSPDSPEEQAVRRYLAEFLADPKVIDYPRWFWLPLLNQIILKSRPARSAKLYQNIWQPAGSPLLLTMDKIAQKLQEALNQSALQEYHVEIGMRYGNPSLQHGIRTLLKKPLDELILLPLFPQYSITTTGTTLEAAIQALNQAENAPFIRTIGSYHDNPAYIAALASSIKNSWNANGKSERHLFSFHGVPQRYQKLDDYRNQCLQTASLVAQKLGLEAHEWQSAFQSRFGPESWLQPYTDETIHNWGNSGVQSISVLAPGFSVDCLETTDELGREARHIFESAGGKHFHYIPALNDTEMQISLLRELILKTI